MKLRPFQLDAVVATFRELATRRSTLVVQATGCGKTVCFAYVAEVWLRRGGRRVLVLAPRDELLEQARATILRAIPRLRTIDVGLEKAESRAAAGTPIVLASPQSLHEDRLASFEPGAFDLIIVDEAHLGGPTMEAIFTRFAPAKRVGFTATPDRLDGKPLVPHPYESIAHVYELPDAIEAGYLSPLEFRQVRVEGLDLSGVRRDAEGGDLMEADLEREMVREEVLAGTAAVVRDQLRGQKTLIFCVTVAHSHLLAEALSLLGVKAAAMDGTAPRGERREVMQLFRAGEVEVLCNCMLYSYGLDVPDLRAVVIARPTLSRALYSQMVGRVTRRAPGKEFGLVVDLVGIVGRHKLVTPAEALAPRSWAIAAPGPDDSQLPGWMQEEDLEESGLRAAEEAESAIAEIDANALADLARRAEVQVSPVAADLAIFGIDFPERTKADRNATTAQIQALERAGVENATFLSFDQAQALFEELEARRAAGLCSLRMGRLLARKGLQPNATFEKAEWAIERIKNNHWCTPPDVVADRELRYGGAAPLKLREN